MDINSIISEIDAEIAKLTSVKEALLGTSAEQGSDRPPSSTKAPVAKKEAKRKISAEGRARMAAAQKARWAKAKGK